MQFTSNLQVSTFNFTLSCQVPSGYSSLQIQQVLLGHAPRKLLSMLVLLALVRVSNFLMDALALVRVSQA